MAAKKKVKAWTPNDLPKHEAGKPNDGWWHIGGSHGEQFALVVYRTFRKITEKEIEFGNYFKTEADAEKAKEAIEEGIQAVFSEFH